MAVVTFSDSESAPVPKCLNPGPVQKIFKFVNPNLVQTLAIIDATEIQQCLYLRNAIYESHTDSSC